jgi:hypothetical protein
MNTHASPPPPWYKQPWLWFILAPLIAVFIYATIFIYIAVTTSDGIVKEDHFRQARGTHIDTTKLDAARRLGIEGTLRFDTLTGDINLQLTESAVTLPARLNLNIIHPTHQKFDQLLTLRSVDGKGIFVGTLAGNLSGKRYITLAPDDESWQLRMELTPPYSDQLSLQLKP